MRRAAILLLSLPSLLAIAGCGSGDTDEAEVDTVAEKISDDAEALVGQRSAEASVRGNEAAQNAQP